MGEFTPIETQEQFDSMIGERLKRERETVKKEYEGFLSPDEVTKKYEGYLSPDDVKKKYEGYLSPDEVAVKDAKIKGYESHSVKTRIAHELGLSYDAVGFLKGDSEEAIRKSAESLKGLVGASNVAPLASTEAAIAAESNEAYKKTLRGMRGD